MSKTTSTSRANTASRPDAGSSGDYADLVRYSRAGDQFHYLWAARRLLRLLGPATPLVAIAIEGVSRFEAEGAEGIDEGEAVVDIAEYDGDERLSHAEAIRYLQLKHSTRQADTLWRTADLKGTIVGFAARFNAIRGEYGDAVAAKITCIFVTNRPIGADLLESVQDLEAAASPRHPQTARALATYAKLKGNAATSFWRALQLRGGEGARRIQQDALRVDLASYLPGPDMHAPLQLKELVVQRALPDAAHDPVVRRMDVLRALGISRDELFPAPNRIHVHHGTVPREQEISIGRKIAAAIQPVIVEAPSGRGKSILSMRLGSLMPAGSATIVYDCYGAGEYRQRAHPRHRHKDALLQIGNELAVLGLCDPLLPSASADTAAYLKALLLRLRQAVETVQRSEPDAVVALVIDAADNSEMGAWEAGDERSFARDLIREPMPDGVRLVMLCRPERTAYLKPPPAVLRIELQPFTQAETASHLRGVYPTASDQDAFEFHRRSSQNPRVQANALAVGSDVRSMLRALGPNPKGVDEAIAEQLQAAICEIIDISTADDRERVNRFCAGIAILRPLIPLDVLAAVSGASVDAIRSFAVDFGGGRPLMVVGDAIQFRDEPVEDWFRTTSRADTRQLSYVIEQLKPLAAGSAYAAAALPSMMLEAGRLDELIEIALASAYLPAGNALQRRDIELQRLQFALRASLKSRRYLDATKLALRAGGEAAGDSRHLRLIQENTDLAGILLDAGTIQDLVSRRGFVGKWLGARHAYEAALLAMTPELAAEARSRLRLAKDWLANWSRQSVEERRRQPVELADIAQLALATLRVQGPDACLRELGSWRPAEVSYRATCLVVTRLVDCDEQTLIAGLEAAVIASVELLPGLALVDELASVGRLPSTELIQALVGRLPREKPIGDQNFRGSHEEQLGLFSVTNLISAALHYRIGRHEHYLGLLDIYLPKEPNSAWANPWSGVRTAYIAAYALRAALTGTPLDPAALADTGIRKEIEAKSAPLSEDTQQFLARVTPILPFALLRAQWAVTPPTNAQVAREALEKAANAARVNDRLRAHEHVMIEGEVATIWFKLLAFAPEDAAVRSAFFAWAEAPDHPLPSNVWISLGRFAARTPRFQDLAHELCSRGLVRERDASEYVDAKIETYVTVARALLPLDRLEAAAYLEQAIDVASRLGDEVFDRWDCILQLGERAITDSPQRPDIAYHFGRCGEIVRGYLDKHFDWTSSLRVLCGLSPEGGLAVVSRWRDRGVGWFDAVLTNTLDTLLEANVIDAREAAAFIGFAFDWDYAKLFKRALTASKSSRERTEILSGFVAYLRIRPPSSQIWRALEAIAKTHRLVASELAEFAAEAEANAAAHNARQPTNASAEPLVADPDRMPACWDMHFGNDPLDQPEGFAAVIARTDYLVRRSEGPNGFWAQACRRVRPGREPAFVTLALDNSALSLLEVDTFLAGLPDAWKSRLAIRAALKSSLELLLKQNHADIWYSRLYQRISLPMVEAVAGESKSWVLGMLLDAFGEETAPLTSSHTFRLVSLLAMNLTPAEAMGGLSYALDLIEQNLRPEDGDGPWSIALQPANGVTDSMAALLWGCLSAPQATIRWQAAHTVRRLCALDDSPVLDRLVALAEGAEFGPFADTRFVFYGYHARLWLVIALARATLDHPKSVARYQRFLLEQAICGEPHVLIRQFGRNAVLTLKAAAAAIFDASTLAQLEVVNCSPYPLESLDRYRGCRQGGPSRDWTSRRFHFAYDMDRYWFEPLGDVFNLTGAAVERVAEEVICDDWNVTSPGGWKTDARRAASVFQDLDYGTTSQGSLPRVDTLDFYISFHALMVAAGRLLATTPAHTDRDNETSRFDEWIDRYLLTSHDGRWLSDRRDPIPANIGDVRFSLPDGNWRWSVTADEIRRGLQCTDDELVVWGSWTTAQDLKSHSTLVTSALVSPATAPDLLRALQSINNPRDFRLPSAGDDAEIEDGEFLLKGWIETIERYRHFDEYDPWAGDIPYPPRAPAAFVGQVIGLISDNEGRAWRLDGEEVIRVEIWGSGHDRDGYAADEGHRVILKAAALQHILKKLKLDLLVEVQVERRLRSRSWDRQRDELEYAYPYSRLFLVRSDGSIHTA